MHLTSFSLFINFALIEIQHPLHKGRELFVLLIPT